MFIGASGFLARGWELGLWLRVMGMGLRLCGFLFRVFRVCGLSFARLEVEILGGRARSTFRGLGFRAWGAGFKVSLDIS